ncbi:MAG: hypothetical protein JKX81_04760 [Arenicella sp.]|nr:hypothetical protein [Arenicella sp.]
MGKHLKTLIAFNIVLIMCNVVLLCIVYFDRNSLALAGSNQSASVQGADSLLVEPKNAKQITSEGDIARFNTRLLAGNETTDNTASQTGMLNGNGFEALRSNEGFETRILAPEGAAEKSYFDSELDAKYRAAAEEYTNSLEVAPRHTKALEITTPSQ